MIGVFDSGVGGLTVAKEIKKLLPDAPIIYVGDTARVPYGTKSKKIIIKYSCQIVDFLVEKGVKVVVIGCNTVSANAAEEIRNKYPHLVIYDVIFPAIRTALLTTKNKKIGIIGTEATINSEVYRRELYNKDVHLKLFERACPLFVPLVEDNRMHTPETKEIIQSYLHDFPTYDIDTLILGCTHYPFLKADIRDFFLSHNKHVSLIDTGHELAAELAHDVEVSKEMKKSVYTLGEDEFYLTDITKSRLDLANKLFGKTIHFNKATIA